MAYLAAPLYYLANFRQQGIILLNRCQILSDGREQELLSSQGYKDIRVSFFLFYPELSKAPRDILFVLISRFDFFGLAVQHRAAGDLGRELSCNLN